MAVKDKGPQGDEMPVEVMLSSMNKPSTSVRPKSENYRPQKLWYVSQEVPRYVCDYFPDGTPLYSHRKRVFGWPYFRTRKKACAFLLERGYVHGCYDSFTRDPERIQRMKELKEWKVKQKEEKAAMRWKRSGERARKKAPAANQLRLFTRGEALDY